MKHHDSHTPSASKVRVFTPRSPVYWRLESIFHRYRQSQACEEKKQTSSVVIPCLQATAASPLPSTLSTAGRDLPTKQLSKGMNSSPAAVLVPGFLLTKQQAFES